MNVLTVGLLSHNLYLPVCCLGVLRHSMMLSLWWDCLSSSLTSLDSPLSPRTRLSIYGNSTSLIVVSINGIIDKYKNVICVHIKASNGCKIFFY